MYSEVIKTVSVLLGIQNTRTSAYHPQGNGQVEHFNRTVESILAKTVDGNQKNWDCCLQKALFAYHTAVHESTAFTPSHLMFGRNPQLLVLGRIEHSRHTLSILKTSTVNSGMHTQLPQNTLLQPKHVGRRYIYDKNSNSCTFQIGDRVWLFVPAVTTGRTKKFASFWRRPYTIIDKTSPVNYKIQLIGGTTTSIVHRNRLKPCFGEPQQCRGKRPIQSSRGLIYNTEPSSADSGIRSYRDVVAGYTPKDWRIHII